MTVASVKVDLRCPFGHSSLSIIMKAKMKGTLKGVPKTKVIGRGKVNKAKAPARKNTKPMPAKQGYRQK